MNNGLTNLSPNSSSGVSSGNVSPDNGQITNNNNNDIWPSTPEAILKLINDRYQQYDFNKRDANNVTALLAIMRYAGSGDGLNISDSRLRIAISNLESLQKSTDLNAQDNGNYLYLYKIFIKI